MPGVSAAPLALTVKSPEGAPWEFLVLFLVVIFGPPLVKRARVPGLVGLLLGGFAIGPHGLGLIGAGDTTVPALGKIGLLYLMFVAGVELDLPLLRVHRKAALGFALLTFSFPMLFGTVLGFGVGFSVAAALLLGSLLASHTLVLYPIARAARLAPDPAVATAVGATVLTDTLALIVLAGVAASSLGGGSSLSIAIQIVVGLGVLLVFSLVVLPRLARIAFRHLGSDRTVRYLLAFASFLAAATVAEMFGIEGIVGAFFAGLALNRLVPNEGPLMEHVEFFGSAVFIPVFIVSVGLLLDPSVMVEGQTLKYAGLFVAACLGGKALAAILTRPLFGYSGQQATMVYALSSPQAAATLAATVVGFDIGLFDTSVVNAVLVLILVSVIVATVLAERAARSMEPPSRARRRLGERVLVAVEDATRARLALALAARIARPDGGVVRALLVRGRQEPHAAEDLSAIAQAGFDAGVDADPRVVVDRSLADAVVHAASAASASLVLVVERERHASPTLGSWAEAVAGAAPAPVGIVRGDAPAAARVRILRAPAGGASAAAATLAEQIAARLVRGVAPRAERRDGRWPDDLGPRGLAIAPVASWELLAEVPEPREGALLLIPEPAAAPTPDAR